MCQVTAITSTNNLDIRILLKSLFVQIASTLNWVLFRLMIFNSVLNNDSTLKKGFESLAFLIELNLLLELF